MLRSDGGADPVRLLSADDRPLQGHTMIDDESDYSKKRGNGCTNVSGVKKRENKEKAKRIIEKGKDDRLPLLSDAFSFVVFIPNHRPLSGKVNAKILLKQIITKVSRIQFQLRTVVLNYSDQVLCHNLFFNGSL